MFPRVILVRHAHTLDNDHGGRLSGRTDVPLSARGWQQVEQLRRWFAGGGGRGRVFSSPLGRARDTAHGMCGLEPAILEDLQEIDCGLLDGQPLELVRTRHSELWGANFRQDDAHFRWPGGESYAELRVRSLRALCSLAAAAETEPVIAVTHAGPISQIVGAAAGVDAAGWGRFRPGNAALTEVACLPQGGLRVLRFDDCRHLEQDYPAADTASARRRIRLQA